MLTALVIILTLALMALAGCVADMHWRRRREVLLAGHAVTQARLDAAQVELGRHIAAAQKFAMVMNTAKVKPAPAAVGKNGAGFTVICPRCGKASAYHDCDHAALENKHFIAACPHCGKILVDWDHDNPGGPRERL